LSRPLVIFAGRAAVRNYAANAYPFRAGSTYLYLGGPPIEGAAWLIEPGSDGDSGCVLIRPVMTPDDVVWMGAPPSDADVAAASGVSLGRLVEPDQLGQRLGGRPGGAIVTHCPLTWDWAKSLGLPAAAPDEKSAIVDLRLIQDEHELRAMRTAASAAVDAQRAAMAATAPGRREAEVHAAFMEVLIARDCSPSFTPIITVRGEVLHSQGYPNQLKVGALLLADAGAEEPGGYASDTTRTYPVDGKWSSTQRLLYDIVLRAQEAAVAACVPGRRFRDIHDMTAERLCGGLVQADLLRGDPADLAQRRAHTLFFVHGLGHLIGLDVHDMEDFGDLAGYAPGRERRKGFGDKFLRLDRDLVPGMSVTIEPGLYLVPPIWRREDLTGPLADVVNRRAVEQLLREEFGGIRIEDTVHVREQGAEPENLTRALPKEADAVAGLVGLR
jgi:Xaa-Pro aminopeptidase